MKRLMRKHVHRYALFALLLLAFLLGSVSTHGFAEMDGQAVMAQAQGKDDANDILTGKAQKAPVVDTEEPETGEVGKIQKELEPVDPPTPEPEKPNDPEQPVVVDPLKNPDSEPSGLKEADKEKTIIPAEENEIQAQPGQVDPNKFPEPPTNEGDTFGSSEDLVPEAVRGGNPVFTVTKRPVDNPDVTEELVGEYDTFADAIENCKQGDLGNLYIITVNSDYTIPSDEYCHSKSSVHILLRSAESELYTLTREGTRTHFWIGSGCEIRIKNLILDGNNDGEFTFISDDGKLTLGAGTIVQNFIDVRDNDGPAIFMSGQSCLTVEPGVVVQNNSSNDFGGLIEARDGTTINITGGKFINNSSTGSGGVVYSAGTLNITGGSFENNSAGKVGGAIMIGKKGKANIQNASFTNNIAKTGGAIYVSGSLSMSGCTLKQNQATWGAAIGAVQPVTLSDITAAENQAASAGGVLYLYEGGKIDDSTFSNNTAAKQGGAIYLKTGDLTLSGSNFTENIAVNGGGALFIGHDGVGNSQVASCAFTQNTSSAFGGGIYLGSNKKLEVISSTFSKNEAAHGGGISTLGGSSDPEKSNLSIQSSTFAENVALSGGGVFTAVPTQINQTAFSSNESVVHPQDDQKNPHVSGTGGALYVMDQQTDITASNFSGNTAYGSGGAICISGEIKDNEGNVTGVKPAIMVNIGTSTRFEGNHVQVGQGGAIYCAPYEYANVITKADAYSKLMMDNNTLFLKNSSGEGLFNPPSNYAKFTNLGFSSDSDVTHGVLTRESVLNNYDVNFKNSACLITYIANGGEFVDGSEQQVEEHELDAEIKLAAAPTRSGYRFTGWQAAQTMYQPGDDYTVKGNATFIAQWEAEDTPTLRYPYPRREIPVFTAPASVAPTPVPAAPSPKKIYNLPATGSASPARSIFMGLGLVLVGLLLKKRS